MWFPEQIQSAFHPGHDRLRVSSSVSPYVSFATILSSCLPPNQKNSKSRSFESGFFPEITGNSYCHNLFHFRESFILAVEAKKASNTPSVSIISAIKFCTKQTLILFIKFSYSKIFCIVKNKFVATLPFIRVCQGQNFASQFFCIHKQNIFQNYINSGNISLPHQGQLFFSCS